MIGVASASADLMDWLAVIIVAAVVIAVGIAIAHAHHRHSKLDEQLRKEMTEVKAWLAAIHTKLDRK